jgi:hypothetical protein
MTDADPTDAAEHATGRFSAIAYQTLIDVLGGLLGRRVRDEVRENDGADVLWRERRTGALVARGCYFAEDDQADERARDNEVVLCHRYGQIAFIGPAADQLRNCGKARHKLGLAVAGFARF